MSWYKLKNLNKSDPAQVVAEIQVPPNSPWFCGHFPGEPILPGVAQLGMVFDIIQLANRRAVKISRVSRVRFKQMVKPDDLLCLTVMPQGDHPGTYSFRLMVANEIVCSGSMVIEPQL